MYTTNDTFDDAFCYLSTIALMIVTFLNFLVFVKGSICRETDLEDVLTLQATVPTTNNNINHHQNNNHLHQQNGPNNCKNLIGIFKHLPNIMAMNCLQQQQSSTIQISPNTVSKQVKVSPSS